MERRREGQRDGERERGRGEKQGNYKILELMRKKLSLARYPLMHEDIMLQDISAAQLQKAVMR